jgi:DNA-binding transcriptional ArsR family regulator
MNATMTSTPLTRFGHALSDPTRIRILEMLRDKPTYPADMVIELATTKQSISNHLACLRGCGLVIAKSEGRRTLYELADERIKHALDDLQQIALSTDPVVCDEANEKDCC